FLGEEQILATVGLGGAARARGGRHGEHAIRPLLEQVLDQRALARTGRTGDDQDEAQFGSGGARRGRGLHEQGAHSTFCTCSRMPSISSFITITAWPISTSFALEPIVFASRFISWSRKLSFRPASSGLSIRCRNWSRCAASRTHSSVQSSRSASRAT